MLCEVTFANPPLLRSYGGASFAPFMIWSNNALGPGLTMQHLPLSQTLSHVRDQAAVFEDGEDFLGEGGEVILITFM